MRRVQKKVPLEECRRRAFAALTGNPVPASTIAEAIWPGTEWRALQGAGAAASRVLKVMEKDGCAAWVVRSYGARKTWGWIKITIKP